MLLADLGADVIKVESPTGDVTRLWGPPFFKGSATYFFGANRNKWDVVLDLKSERDRGILAELVRQADVIVQNFTGTTARKLGVDYKSIHELNPAAIHLSLWAMGPEDPDCRGYDLIAQALSGMMSITGEPGREPVKVGAPVSDLAAAMYGAMAVTAALFDRQNNGGQGKRLDVSLYDSVLALLPSQSMNWLLCQEDTERHGSDHPAITPYGSYRTADAAIVVAVGTDDQFAELCQVIGMPDVASETRFKRNRDRVAHRADLRAILEAQFAMRPSREWEVALSAAGIPHARVRTVPEALESHKTNTVYRMRHPTWGEIAQIMNPIRIAGDYLRPYLAPPSLGEHTPLVIAAPALSPVSEDS